jgi:hypothetical protein
MRTQKTVDPSSLLAQKRYVKPNDSRRGFIRVDFEPGSRILIPRPDGAGELSFDGLDLSVYGLSFLARPEDAAHFPIGSAVPSLSFSVDNRPVRVVGRVAYLHTGLVAGLSKVAIEFTEVSMDDIWFLSRHVAQRSGVDKPGQIGAGLIELRKLIRQVDRARARRRAKGKPQAKTKAKAKSGRKTTSQRKAASRPKPKAKVRRKPTIKRARRARSRR